MRPSNEACHEATTSDRPATAGQGASLAVGRARKARLIIADDHPAICQGLSEIIGRADDLAVVAAAYDGVEAERLARTLPAELLVIDIAMPQRSGIKVLESLRSAGLALPVLFFSMHAASQYVAYLKRAGAQGFLGKEADDGTLLRAIRQILDGETVFPDLSHRSSGGGEPHWVDIDKLSARENDVLHQLVRGTSLVDIADQLGISSQSVTTYRRRILDKLNVANNAELISLVSRFG